MKVREGGRVVKIAVMVATGVNADEYREILGIHTATTESGPAWLAFFRDLTARGLTAPARSGWSPPTPTPAWSRRSGHPARHGLAAVPHRLRREPDERDTPKSSWGWVKALLHTRLRAA